MEQVFQINTPSVVHEMIDDEVVIVDLDTGRYYSIDKVGADIWRLLGDHGNVEDIVAWISSHYDAEESHIESSVLTMIAELKQEQLIVPYEAQNGSKPEFTPAANTTTRSFSEPKLHKYTDMEELLLLDPIHEVDDTGWPNAK